MAYSIQINRLCITASAFVIIISGCSPRAPKAENRFNAELDLASLYLFRHVTASDPTEFQKIRGAANMNCKRRADEVVIEIPSAMYNNLALSAIRPDGEIRKIHFTEQGEYLASGVHLLGAGPWTEVVVKKSVSADTTRSETAPYDRRKVIWDDSGYYVFVVTDYLPIWRPDYDSQLRPDQFKISAYCSIDLPGVGSDDAPTSPNAPAR